ncbi:hypothetical protein PV08_00073 [Exophiala spinifera]|uniref:NTF2-like domain-containing protein n=1 Tax=Exophiala spinifera TaxID=91928 RepID=A0A0D1YW83_9EURO|nr:uncharacterized protein PV08_00073 [Exophiala spinifera]KIW19501.1 hypothetical protein PV08_00073 [Exophiala spinifera]
MKFLGVVTSLALASTAVAAPGWTPWQQGGKPQGPSSCLTQNDANDIVNKFISVLDHPDVDASNATAQALIADGFFEKSDSINLLAGFPAGSDSFSGKAQYIQGVLLAPSVTGINTNMILPAGCTKVVWYWTFTGIGSKQLPVNGINIFDITPDKKQIAATYVEFNSIAWGIDTGYTVYGPDGTKLPLA